MNTFTALFPADSIAQAPDVHLVPIAPGLFIERQPRRRVAAHPVPTTPPLWFEESFREPAPQVAHQEVVTPQVAEPIQVSLDEESPCEVAPCAYGEEWEKLHAQYYERLVRYAQKTLGHRGDQSDAEDIAMQAFLRVMPHCDEIEPGAIATYLYRTVTRLICDRARRRKCVPMVSLDASTAAEDEHAGMPEPRAEHSEVFAPSEDEALTLTVRQKMLQLSEDHRAVLVMHHLQDMEVKEIAEVLGVPAGTVKSRLARGRARLGRKLKWVLEMED